jgi:hypothetical protein
MTSRRKSTIGEGGGGGIRPNQQRGYGKGERGGELSSLPSEWPFLPENIGGRQRREGGGYGQFGPLLIVLASFA